MSRGLPLQLVWTRGESLPAAESGRLRLSISSSWSRRDGGVEEKQQASFDLHCWQLCSKLWYLAQGFRAPLTVWMGSWGWLQGCGGGGLEHCRVLSSIPGLYPREMLVVPTGCVQDCFQTWLGIPWGHQGEPVIQNCHKLASLTMHLCKSIFFFRVYLLI